VVETQRVAARRPSEACRSSGTFAPKSVNDYMGWQGIPFLAIIELDRSGPTVDDQVPAWSRMEDRPTSTGRIGRLTRPRRQTSGS
jgi:hypothetical protein